MTMRIKKKDFIEGAVDILRSRRFLIQDWGPGTSVIVRDFGTDIDGPVGPAEVPLTAAMVEKPVEFATRKDAEIYIAYRRAELIYELASKANPSIPKVDKFEHVKEGDFFVDEASGSTKVIRLVARTNNGWGYFQIRKTSRGCYSMGLGCVKRVDTPENASEWLEPFNPPRRKGTVDVPATSIEQSPDDDQGSAER